MPAQPPASAPAHVSPRTAVPSHTDAVDDNTHAATPDPAPAEMVPAEHAELPSAPAQHLHGGRTQPMLTPASTPQKPAGVPLAGLLPALKMQVETLEDNELEMRL